MTDIAFTPFPKIGRLEKDMIITEKIDGTNAAVGVTEDGQVYAQSRKQLITPEKDNMGFARWVAEHEDELRDGLGPGIHFGEWWGLGIQRNYGLGEKRFSLFNVGRWSVVGDADPYAIYPDGDGYRCVECPVCYVVPVMRRHTFDTDVIKAEYALLKMEGSWAVPGFSNPEGIVVFHTAQGHLYKLSDAKVPPKQFDRDAVQS